MAVEKKNKSITWHWLRTLLKIVEELSSIEKIIEKVKESLIEYTQIDNIEIHLIDDPSTSNNAQKGIDELANSDFFSRKVIENIFLLKEPSHISKNEIIYPLENSGRILGLVYIKTPNKIDQSSFELLWSFMDQLAALIHNIILPQNKNPESKIQIKDISNSIFNNLKSFLEASLERLGALEEQNQKLVELNRTRTELINNVSHELRTPLVSIMGFSNILQRHEIKPDLIREASEQIQSAGGRLSRMIDDLLQLNRASTKGWVVNVERLDLGEIAKYVVESLSPLHKNYNFTFNYPEKEYPLIGGDRKLIRQVIENLLINAIKYSPEGGEINCTIKDNTKEKKLSMFITDNGIGMTPAENQKIFERFYRAKNPKTENISGLGLGLTICKDVVEALNGEISSTSDFGQGSCFIISFNY